MHAPVNGCPNKRHNQRMDFAALRGAFRLKERSEQVSSWLDGHP